MSFFFLFEIWCIISILFSVWFVLINYYFDNQKSAFCWFVSILSKLLKEFCYLVQALLTFLPSTTSVLEFTIDYYLVFYLILLRINSPKIKYFFFSISVLFFIYSREVFFYFLKDEIIFDFRLVNRCLCFILSSSLSLVYHLCFRSSCDRSQHHWFSIELVITKGFVTTTIALVCHAFTSSW